MIIIIITVNIVFLLHDMKNKKMVGKCRTDFGGPIKGDGPFSWSSISRQPVGARVFYADRPSPPRFVRVDCTSEVAEVFWRSGPNNNDPISEFIVYSRDWSPDDETPSPFNRSALSVAGRTQRRGDAR